MDRVLLNCEDRYIKGLLLRILVEANIDVLEATDEEDVLLKMSLFDSSIVLYIVEISNSNRDRIYSEIIKMQKSKNAFKGSILALIPDDSIAMVSGALKAGISDVLLLPPKKDHYKKLLIERIYSLTHKQKKTLKDNINKKQISEGHLQIREEQAGKSYTNFRTEIEHQLKLANRGNYTVSLLMVEMEGLTKIQQNEFQQLLLETIRDTDELLDYEQNIFIIVCPFTNKEFLIEVERKLRTVYQSLFGDFSDSRRVFLYGTNYPTEEKDIQMLLKMMEDGVEDSKVFSSMKQPLNTLTANEIADFRKKLKRYKM